MHKNTQLIKEFDLTKANKTAFNRRMACCIILTYDNKILLQQRSAERKSFPNCVTTFGGGIEDGEEPLQALIRELYEELGAQVQKSDVVSLGAITEAITNHTEIIYGYFWHDKTATITGCYEDSPLYFDDTETALAYPGVMDYVPWLLAECKQRELLKLF